QKIIQETPEMIFLADDIYPFPIIYANESFEENIGSTLSDRSLIGLGLDMDGDLSRGEFTLSHRERTYTYKLDSPDDHEANCFLFYKGKESKGGNDQINSEVLNAKHTLWGIGRDNYLTNICPRVSQVLGFDSADLVQTKLCDLIHEDDLKRILPIWDLHKRTKDSVLLRLRFRRKDGEIG